MKNLPIPQEDLEALLLFENQNTEIKVCILKVFNDLEKGQDFEITAQKISQTAHISFEDSILFTGVYFALIRTIGIYNYNREEFITNVVDSTANKFKLNKKDKTKLDNAIKTLLTIDNPNPLLTSLASYLTSQHSNLITGFNVFSDLKPIKSNNQIEGLALCNILKLRYRGATDEENQIYFTFDYEDLNELIIKLTELKETNQLLKAKYGEDIIEI